MNCIYIQIVLNFIPNGPIDNKLSVGLIMECHQTDDKPHWGRDKMAAIFADDIFKCIFLNEKVWIPIEIPLKFVP